MIAEAIGLGALGTLVVADARLTTQIIAKGGREVGFLASRLIGSTPSATKVYAFAAATTVPYLVIIALCWDNPDTVAWGWGLLGWTAALRTYIIERNWKVFKSMQP